jgi:hypothetical protein
MMTSMTAGVGNWIRAGALALGLSSFGAAGCTGESFPDGTIPPIDQPDPNDTTIPDTPQANMDACFPADSAGSRFRILVEANGGRVGTSAALPLGQFRMVMPSGSLTLDAEGAGDGVIPFHGTLHWDSTPAEYNDIDSNGPVPEPLFSRTGARLVGRPLTDLNMTVPDFTGPWSTKFPGFADANRVGFRWPVEGEITYSRSGGQVTNCALDLTIRTNAQTNSGSGPALDYLALSLYPPRPDGRPYMASADFAGETAVILAGVFSVVLDTAGTWETVCDGDCAGIPGSSVNSVRFRILRNAPMAAHSDGGVDGSGGAGGHDSGTGGSDAGMGGDSGG